MNRRSFFKRFVLAGFAAGAGYAGLGYMRNPYYSGPVSDHFDGTRFFIKGHSADKGIADLWKWRGEPKVAWPESFPSPFQEKPPERVGAGKIRVTHIGHASFLLQTDGQNILIDPVYSDRVSPVSFAGPKRVNPPGVSFADLPPIDHVLVTHGHYDHLDVSALTMLQQKFKPQFLCPLGNDTIIRSAVGQDAKITTRDWGAAEMIGSIKVHLEPSYHWSARGMLDRRKQLWCAFVFETVAGKIYHIGDTGYHDGAFFKAAKEKHGGFKLAVIPIGAYAPRWFMSQQHVNPEEAVKIFNDCGAEQAIGHHWGTFQLTNEAIEEPPQLLVQAAATAGIGEDRFRASRPGQVFEV